MSSGFIQYMKEKLGPLVVWIDQKIIRPISKALPLPILIKPLDTDRNYKNAVTNSYLIKKQLNMPVLFTDRFNLSYLLYPSDPLFLRFLYDGDVELAEFDFCKKYLKQGMTVFDVGANIGVYSILLASTVGQGNVHVFEPFPWTFKRLKQNLGLNGFSNVNTNPVLVYSEDLDEYDINIFPKEFCELNSIGMPDIQVDGKPLQPESVEKVKAITLDSYCDANKIDSIDFLKLDVEGAELDVFQGSDSLLSNGKINCILFEISMPMIRGVGHKPEEVFDFLHKRKYTIYRLSDQGALEKIDSYSGKDKENFIAIPDQLTPDTLFQKEES